MTSFVESCVGTVAGSAVSAERRAQGRPRAKKLLALLQAKRDILVTTHQHPDPDALGSGMALCTLLAEKLPARAKVSFSIKGQVGGGLNDAFIRNSPLRVLPWNDSALTQYDAIILLDTQPQFNYSPLPSGVMPLAVIDHHRGGRSKKPDCPFCDIRTDVGATSSIVFSYFMELEVPIRPDLAATLLYAIESDLAGAAGTPGELDNVALSGLTLLADPRKLYQMRYVDLPQSYYIAYFHALQTAIFHENALMSHLGAIDSLEKPAVMGDFLMRFDKVQWALVTAVADSKLFLSLRTSSARSAGDVMRRILRKIGEGGGHRTKAGGVINIAACAGTELEDLRRVVWRRYLRALGFKYAKGEKLVPQ